MYSGTPAAFAASITSSSVRRLPGDSSTPSVNTTTAFLPGTPRRRQRLHAVKRRVVQQCAVVRPQFA